MKVPPKRKGNFSHSRASPMLIGPSMKVPPKRKGNTMAYINSERSLSLNESPSEKEGK